MLKGIEEKMADEGAKSLFQLCWSIIKEFGTKTIDEVKVKTALNSYADNFIHRHGQIKILGMTEPRPIQKIYTSVKIVKTSYLVQEKEIEKLESAFREGSRQFMESHSTKTGISIANNEQYLNILGGPGSGKSTFVKRVGIDALLKESRAFNNDTEKYLHDCIPVLIELKRFRNEDVNLQSIIQKEFEIADFPQSDYFVTKALKAGKFLILLDGLDEVPLKRLDEVIQHIKDFTDKYKKNRFITSCRTAFYKTYLKNFTDIEIAPFDNYQIKSFISNWFSSIIDLQVDTASIFKKLLFDVSHKSTLELARTPLLLTFLCLTFDESQRFPSNRSNLYRRALMILLEKWAAEKRIHNDDIYLDLTPDLEIEMLAEVAAKFYEEDKIFFYTQEIKDSLKKFLESSLSIKSINLSKVLEAIETQQGLLVQRAPEIYSFSHLTIQEYLTAYYYNSPQGINVLISKNLFNKRWREVFLLLAGIGKADEMLVSIASYIKKVTYNNQLYLKVVKWISKALPQTENHEKDACKRIFLLGLMLSYKRYDETVRRNEIRMEDYTNNLLNSLNESFSRSFIFKSNISRLDADNILSLVADWQRTDPKFSIQEKDTTQNNSDQSLTTNFLESRQNLHHQIMGPLYDGLRLPKEMRFLTKDKYKDITTYLEAYTLLIDCKNSALRVSKETWKLVCNEILK